MVTFVDIGARGGIKQKWRMIRDQLHVVCFEPDPVEFEELKKFVWWENATLIQQALWCMEGELDFHVMENKGLSSVYKMNPAMEGRLDSQEFKINKTVRMPVKTLDSFDLKPNFIKLDTQGSELDILRGGVESLRHTFGVEVEVEFEPVYDGQPTFCDVNSFMEANGFQLWDITTRYLSGDPRPVLFGDAVYFKTGTENDPGRQLIQGVYEEKGL